MSRARRSPPASALVCYWLTLFRVRQLPVRPDEVAGVAVGILLQVVLVLGLGLPERPGRRDLGDHLARPQAGGLDVGDRVLGDPPLLVAGVEDRRPVAGADVVALPVERGRVVDLEEELQQVPVGDLLRVEDDLDGLGVGAVVAVGRVRARRRRCSRRGWRSRPGRLRIRSCIPQKQPPARMAFSRLSLIVVHSLSPGLPGYSHIA